MFTATTGLDMSTTPTAQPTSGGFFDSIGSILGNFALGYGSGLATRGTASGRTPGSEQFVNPTQQTLGAPGQPGTTPATAQPTVGATLQKYAPWLLIGGGILAAVVLVNALKK